MNAASESTVFHRARNDKNSSPFQPHKSVTYPDEDTSNFVNSRGNASRIPASLIIRGGVGRRRGGKKLVLREAERLSCRRHPAEISITFSRCQPKGERARPPGLVFAFVIKQKVKGMTTCKPCRVCHCSINHGG